MPAKDLGTKHVCFKCGAKFYDLKKPEARCPKCGADQRQSPANRPPPEARKGRLAAIPKVIEPVVPVEPEGVDDEEELEGFDEDTEVDEDEA